MVSVINLSMQEWRISPVCYKSWFDYILFYCDVFTMRISFDFLFIHFFFLIKYWNMQIDRVFFYCSFPLSCRIIMIKRLRIIWAWIMLPNEFWRPYCQIVYHHNNRSMPVIMNSTAMGHTLNQRWMKHRKTSTSKSWFQCWNKNMER